MDSGIDLKCICCGREDFVPVIDLGEQPWCNDFLSEGEAIKYPLKVVMCVDCNMWQLNYRVAKEVMFAEHDYRSGTTKSLKIHFDKLADKIYKKYNIKETSTVVDIGGNDGTQLVSYYGLGVNNIWNIESCFSAAFESKCKEIPTINTFFNEGTARDLFKKGSVDVVNAAGVFFHLEELESVIKGIKYMLRDDGVLVLQCMYLRDIVEKYAFDAIYHEHLCYYSVRTLANLLSQYGFLIRDVTRSPIHNGSIIVEVQKSQREPWFSDEETQRVDELYAQDFNLDPKLFRRLVETYRDNFRFEMNDILNQGFKAYRS